MHPGNKDSDYLKPVKTLHPSAITIVSTVLNLPDKELVSLQKQELQVRIAIEKNQLEAQKKEKVLALAREKNDSVEKAKKEIANNTPPSNDTITLVSSVLERQPNIQVHRSNFYKKVNFYQKIDKITTRVLDSANLPINEERTVERKNFGSFILNSNKLPLFIDEEAIIELIAPVILKGKFKWKGVYKEEVIFFDMRDKDFKEAVLSKRIEFTSGIAIKCVLQRDQYIDDVGVIKTRSNAVLTVLETRDSDNVVITAGSSPKKVGKNINQLDIFDPKP